jgi:hypothetical protein
MNKSKEKKVGLVMTPRPVPTDPDQKLIITCAQCGVSIDFRKQEVFTHTHSYVCRKHAEGNDE